MLTLTMRVGILWIEMVSLWVWEFLEDEGQAMGPLWRFRPVQCAVVV